MVGPLSASFVDKTANEKTSEVATTTWETLFSEKPFAKLARHNPSPAVFEPQAQTSQQGTKRKAPEALEEQEGTPIKRRLRPRKPPVEPEVVITEVRPRLRPRPKKNRKPAASKKKKPAATTQKPTTRRAKTPKEEPKKEPKKEPQLGSEARASVEIQEVRKGKQTQPIEIPSTDEEQA